MLKLIDALDMSDELFPNNELKQLLRDERKKMQTQFHKLCDIKQTLIGTCADEKAVSEIEKMINDLGARIESLQSKFGSKLVQDSPSYCY